MVWAEARRGSARRSAGDHGDLRCVEIGQLQSEHRGQTGQAGIDQLEVSDGQLGVAHGAGPSSRCSARSDNAEERV